MYYMINSSTRSFLLLYPGFKRFLKGIACYFKYEPDKCNRGRLKSLEFVNPITLEQWGISSVGERPVRNGKGTGSNPVSSTVW